MIFRREASVSKTPAKASLLHSLHECLVILFQIVEDVERQLLHIVLIRVDTGVLVPFVG